MAEDIWAEFVETLLAMMWGAYCGFRAGIYATFGSNVAIFYFILLFIPLLVWLVWNKHSDREDNS